MRIGNLLRLSYWLDPAVLDHRAGNLMWLVVAVGLAWAIAGILLVVRGRRVKSPLDFALAQVVAGGLIAAVALGRLFAVPLLGLRIGWLLGATVAVAPLVPRLIRQAWQDDLAGDCLRAVAFAPRSPDDSRSWRPATVLAWLGLHLVGLAAVVNIIRLPIWIAPLLIGLTLAPAAAALAWRWRPGRSGAGRPAGSPLSSLSALAPLLLVYTVLGLRLLVSLVARIAIGQFRVVDPFGALLNLPLALIVMGAYGLVVAVYQAFTANEPSESGNTRSATFARVGAVALIAGAVAWAIWTALVLHTQGVSGSDPYAYAQMGVDLAERGTVFHSFPLIRLTYALNIPSEPIIHIGYRLPQDVLRVATTVWPPGYAAFTALAYKLAGEQGLYLVTPLLSLLSLAAVASLALVLLQPRAGTDAAPPGFALVVAALAVFLTATSYQQVEWQLIPMADIAAQLFSLLALALAWRAGSRQDGGVPRSARSAAILAALSGLALGVAFDIRYTQVLIAPALLFALFAGSKFTRRPSGQLWLRLVAFALAALIAVAPVLVYHTIAFGSPFRTGSEELANFSLPRLPETLATITSQLASPREFGLLLPFIAVGLLVLWRRDRRALLALAIYFVPLFLLHIAYAYLRPRDILSLFPILAFLAALGAAWLVMWLVKRQAADGRRVVFHLLQAALLITLSVALVLRSMDTLALPVTHGFGAFGYLVSEQRASFTRLSAITPANAAIGCSLNSGAVDLHAGRLAFRPATWSQDELVKFVRALQAENTPVYVLEDGDELAATMRGLRQDFQVTEVARLDMPYYFPGSGSENRKVGLYRVAIR